MQTEFIKIITLEYNDIISCFIWLKTKKTKKTKKQLLTVSKLIT